MVVLCVNDLHQGTFLEVALIDNHIEYEVVLDKENKYGLGLPYLLVDGVPLDMVKAIRWIKEQTYERNYIHGNSKWN